MRILFTLFSFLLVQQLCAQRAPRPFNDETKPFFEAQIPYLEAWMADMGYDQVLAYDYMELRPGQLTIYLYLNKTDKEVAIQAWKGYRINNEEQNNIDVADELHGYVAFLMEQPREKILIEVYDISEAETENNDVVPTYYFAMLYQHAEFRSIEQKGSKSEGREIEIPKVSLQPDVNRSTKQLSKAEIVAEGKAVIMDETLTFCHEYFESRGAEVSYKRGRILQIEVMNLEREVLKKLPPSIIESLFGLAKKERLLLEFSFVEEEKNYILLLKMHGMFGSGIYSITDSGYRPMEPDYKSYLRTFTSNFNNELADHLLKTFEK